MPLNPIGPLTDGDAMMIYLEDGNNTIESTMKKKYGLLSLPIDTQKMLIRTLYYPTPDDNEDLLVYLLQHGAINHTSSIDVIPSDVLDGLITAEHIIKKGTKYHLSDVGMIIAKGTISLYPNSYND